MTVRPTAIERIRMGRQRRWVRESRRVKLADLAKQLGVTEQSLHDWEAGHYWPLPEVVARWDAELRVELA